MWRRILLLVASVGLLDAFGVVPVTLARHHTTSLFMASSSSDVDTHTKKPMIGSVVTCDISLKPEGDFVPEPLFELEGEVTFVLGGGNYLPGLHDLVLTMVEGETVENVDMDAGWGARNDDLVAVIQKADMEQSLDVSLLKPGVQLQLANGMKCTVTEVTDATFTIDANPPLAGASYSANVKLLQVHDGPTQLEYIPEGTPDSKYQVATFALGCFWGGELAFMRQEGVVGTKVGYTHGQVENPSYKDVCSGTTGHTEAIMVTYDPDVVSYSQLVHLAMDRLGENKYLKNQVGNDRGTQYRHGVYFHNDNQKTVAREILDSFGDDCVTELEPAVKFWDAEDYHQQYLLKGGQSARKNDDSTIRCYG